MVEEWRRVEPPFADYYEVSNLGRVRSYHNFGDIYGGRSALPRLKTPKLARTGYLHVVLCAPGHRRDAGVHRLVAEAFIAPDKRPVNHIDGNKTNNCAQNLEYTTAQENALHATRTLGIGRGVRNGRAKITDDVVQEIRASKKTNVALAKLFGLHKQTVCRIKRGHIWRHVHSMDAGC